MTRGSVFVMAADAVNMALLLAYTVIVARYLDAREFGLFNLALALVRVLAIASGLGFRQGVPRFVSACLAKQETARAWSVVRASTLITVAATTAVAVALFAAAGWIARLLDKPDLALTLRIMTPALWFFSLIDLVVAQLRGMRDTVGRAVYEQTLRPLVGIGLMLPVLAWGLSYTWVLWAHNASYLVGFAALGLYAWARLRRALPERGRVPVVREIVLFSLPLWAAGVLSLLMTNTDVVMLGYFGSAEMVGEYSGAVRLARLIPFISASTSFVFLPVASHLCSAGDLSQLKRVHAATTKWVFMFTLPLILLTLVAAEPVLGLFFGKRFAGAAVPLQILTCGLGFSVLMGLNGQVCISLGEVRTVFAFELVCFVGNVILNALLIPAYGATGAAAATAMSIAIANIGITIRVARLSGVHPFTKAYLRLIAIVAVATGVLLASGIGRSPLGLALLVPVLLAVAAAAVLGSRCVTPDDVEAIGAIEERATRKRWFTKHVVARLTGGRGGNSGRA